MSLLTIASSSPTAAKGPSRSGPAHGAGSAEEPGPYAHLKRLVQEAGLLEKTPSYYLGKLAQALALTAASLTILATVDALALQLLNAVFLAVAFTQLGMIGHDAGHRQIFRHGPRNDLLGLALMNLLMGFSFSWWVDKHNRHHNHPNHLDHDPDIDFPVVIFATEQAAGKPWLFRLMIKYQAYLFIPLLGLLAFKLHLNSIDFLWRVRPRYLRLEVLFLALHIAWYGTMVFALLGLTGGLLFVVVHQSFLGLFLGSIFASNHKGMPILGHGVELGYIERQVITSRNLKYHPVTDYWYGPLANQIEHHLFPTLPRSKLRTAEGIVKQFCAANQVPYHETGPFESYCEIIRHLHRVSAPLRARARAPGKKEEKHGHR